MYVHWAFLQLPRILINLLLELPTTQCDFMSQLHLVLVRFNWTFFLNFWWFVLKKSSLFQYFTIKWFFTMWYGNGTMCVSKSCLFVNFAMNMKRTTCLHTLRILSLCFLICCGTPKMAIQLVVATNWIAHVLSFAVHIQVWLKSPPLHHV